MLLAQNLDAVQNVAGLPFQYTINSVGKLITVVLPYVFGAAAIAMLIYLVTAGLQMMTSQGNPKEMEGAQHKITNAILGFVIIFIAFSLVQLVGSLFNLSTFKDIFK